MIKNVGYKQSQRNHTSFIKHLNSGRVTTLLVYIDNIIMMGNDEKKEIDLKAMLNQGI